MTTWNKGAPPSIGWWPASGSENKRAIRWWNGKYWSRVVYPSSSKNEVAYAASKKEDGFLQEQIEWTDRWWL